ncbi:hypothetical protein EOM39_05705 [Candidatus Gracilibacteria bacterium]|nr:hypothetical protein [Candidatus Gracilibacteria bacterium]
MKQILKNKIIDIDSNYFDNKFLFEIYNFSKGINSDDAKIIYMSDLLEKRKNETLLEKVKVHPAMWSEVYSPSDELEIFTEIFENAISKKEKTHIIGITLKEEVEMLEKYYEELGFFDESINCYKVDFKIPYISTSVDIKNLIWRGSDYKRMGKEIFFVPPIREAGQVKSMYKGINRGSIAGIYIDNIGTEEIEFLQKELKEEHILPLTLAKVLNYNYKDLGVEGEKIKMEINY